MVLAKDLKKAFHRFVTKRKVEAFGCFLQIEIMFEVISVYNKCIG